MKNGSAPILFYQKFCNFSVRPNAHNQGKQGIKFLCGKN